MTEHVTQWLEPYYDGELRGRRAQQVEEHLETCSTCLAEFESLDALSALLKEFPEARNLTPVDTFAAQVGLRLPRKAQESKGNKFFRVGWQWVPIGLLATWVFVQTAFFVNGFLTWVLRVFPGAEQFTGFLQSNTQTESFFGAASNLNSAEFTEIGQFWLNILRGGGPFGWAVTLNLILTLVLGLLYLSWLASWWVQKSNGDNPSKNL
jgi:hypothetical protein